MSSAGVETIIGNLPKQKTFIVSSIFESGLVDFDYNVAFINLETLEEFFNLDNEDRNLEIYLDNPQNIEYQKSIVQNIKNICCSLTKCCDMSASNIYIKIRYFSG